MNDTLVVITPAQWLVNELRTAAEGLGISVKQDYGLGDMIAPENAVWGSMHFVVKQAPDHRFLDAGPGFLPSLPYEFTQRDFEFTTLHALRLQPERSAFYKLANMKLVDGTTDREAFIEEIDSHKYVSEDTEILISDIKDFLGSYEFRSFVCNGKAVTTCYLDSHGRTWNAEGFIPPDDSLLETANSFAEEAAASTEIPSGFVIDTALLASGEFIVIEGNPAWCSNPYYLAENSHTVETIMASQRGEGELWKPDPTLKLRAEMFSPRQRS